MEVQTVQTLVVPAFSRGGRVEPCMMFIVTLAVDLFAHGCYLAMVKIGLMMRITIKTDVQ